MSFHFCYFAHFCSFLCILTNPAPEIPLLLFINIRQFPCFETMGRFSLSPCEKECALAHSRAEARLLQQPSTTAPSAHLCKLCLLLWNREFYRNFLFHNKKYRTSPVFPKNVLYLSSVLFYLYQLNLEIQFLSCHFMVGIEGDGAFSLSCNRYREMLAILILQVNTYFCRSHRRKDTVFSYSLWIDL